MTKHYEFKFSETFQQTVVKLKSTSQKVSFLHYTGISPDFVAMFQSKSLKIVVRVFISPMVLLKLKIPNL